MPNTFYLSLYADHKRYALSFIESALRYRSIGMRDSFLRCMQEAEECIVDARKYRDKAHAIE